MKKNDFLIVDSQGNIATISADKTAELLRGMVLDVQLRTYNKHTKKNIVAAKKVVENYLIYQWESKEK